MASDSQLHDTANLTIVFADLVGSTALFENLGNQLATKAVTKITRWISEMGQAYGGRTVKHLGDGVLMAFGDSQNAVRAAVNIQREHVANLKKWQAQYHAGIQIGIADGLVVEVANDIFGDAVNTASRLSDMAGSGQIWCLPSVALTTSRDADYKMFCLGDVELRGKAQPVTTYTVVWNDAFDSQIQTIAPAHFNDSRRNTHAATLHLLHLDQLLSIESPQTPVSIGRQATCNLVINNPRVSRIHALLDCERGIWTLRDVSTYGTWLRFEPHKTEISLRRTHSVLHDKGEISLGAPFDDPNSIVVSFNITKKAVKFLLSNWP